MNTKTIKKVTTISMAILLLLSSTSCSIFSDNQLDLDKSPDPIETERPDETDEPVKEEIVSKLPLDLSDIRTELDQTGNYKEIFEAEDAKLAGGVRIEKSHPTYSGTGYVTNFLEPNESKVVFKLSVPAQGYYNLIFTTAAPYGEKYNTVLIDDINIGEIHSNSEDFEAFTFNNIYLDSGEHDISVVHSWGWFLLDALTIETAEGFDTNVFNVSPGLVNKNTDDVTKRLMKFLTDVYGKYIISGQYGTNGFTSPEFSAIKRETGRYPAMAGLDLIEYSPSRVSHGSEGKSIEAAIDWWERGGLVTFCWHWNAPDKYLPNTDDNPWWSGFYTRATNIDLAKIMDGQDQEGYELLLSDIDAIAVQLKRLEDAGIPILWRPLHEASGGWFWWGASGNEPFIELWKLLYERLTYEHELNNLIWVWNGQAAQWYPGDGYVDIIGEDIYPGEKQYGSQSARFNQALDYTDTNKIIALTENGSLFDPELAFKENARWAWFSTWEGEFVINTASRVYSEQYTERHMLNKVYSHDRVLSLIDIPDISTYPMD
ncbi:MAG TPA: glycosyl hydrolase [Bacillota bacterium]|nr:glycosyl hydrolase [Bacillota bacterium]